MKISTVALHVGGALLALGLAAAAIAQSAAGGDAQRGKQLFLMNGCYTCHGTAGNGAATGPKLAPGPIPMVAFAYQLRHPRGTPRYGNIRMPQFGPKILSNAQIADIYAYLASIPPDLPLSQIPLLNQ